MLSVLILTFIRTLEAFEIPALIGIPAGIEVFTTEIYLQLTDGYLPEYGNASAYSVLLIALVALAMVPYYRVTQHAHRFTTVTGKGFNPPGARTWAGGAGWAAPRCRCCRCCPSAPCCGRLSFPISRPPPWRPSDN